MAPGHHRPLAEPLRFLIAGAVNTAITYGIYWLLLRYGDYRVAYTSAYVFGIVLSYLLSNFFVFGTSPGVRSALAFPLVYLAQYVIGLGVLGVWVSWLRLPPWSGILIVTIVSIPVTFVLSRQLLRKLE